MHLLLEGFLLSQLSRHTEVGMLTHKALVPSSLLSSCSQYLIGQRLFLSLNNTDYNS